MMRSITAAIVGILITAIPLSAQWTQLPGKGTHSCLAFYPGETFLLAATQDSNILRSTDQGATWTPSNDGIQDSLYTYTLYGEGNRVFLGSNKGGYSSSDGGVHWSKIEAGAATPTSIRAFHRDGAYLFMAGDSGVFRSTDVGAHWERVVDGLPQSAGIRSLGSNEKYLYAGTQGHAVYRSSDYGEHWALSGTGMTSRTTLVLFIMDGPDIMGLYENGGFHRSSDYGDTWQLHLENFIRASGTAYSVLQFQNLWFIGTDVGIIRSSNKGATWDEISREIDAPVIIPSMSISNGYMYAGTLNRWIWRRPLSEIIPPSSVEEPAGPFALRLNQNIPNSTATETRISYTLPSSELVSLKLYDAMMREMATMVDERQDAGEHTAVLDAGALPSGVYYYRLSTGASSLTRRMVILR